MFGGSKKPYTAITVQIERLTSEAYEENDVSGIVDLVEVIRLQNSGPTEAARAIRKKLKYGSVHRQLRALTILDGLIQNAGPRFQRAFADEPLLERLRVAATDPISDAEVKAKCKVLFGQWSVSYKDTAGMERICALYKQLPQRKKPRPQQQSKVLRETEAEAAEETSPRSHRASSLSSTPSSSSRPSVLSQNTSPTSLTKPPKTKKDKSRMKAFNIEKEKPQLLQTLASASVASTNLLNALKLINREKKRVSEDPEVIKRFEECKLLRRQILKYIQVVESEQWLGGLIHANDELVNALMAFEVLDKSVDHDSDSEDEEMTSPYSPLRNGPKSPSAKDATEGFAGLTLGGSAPPKPPRPVGNIPMPPRIIDERGKARQEDSDEPETDEEDEDEDDPFADRNAVSTPNNEREEPTW
ncbi:MAG: putative actin patch assembly and actin polymerization protein [Piccolia ochrophora]|nr:MAG: putative actin patch assembly and actin polymerization protein [Piccolia ochrophora]